MVARKPHKDYGVFKESYQGCDELKGVKGQVCISGILAKQYLKDPLALRFALIMKGGKGLKCCIVRVSKLRNLKRKKMFYINKIYGCLYSLKSMQV